MKKLPTTSWLATSAAVTKLTAAEALALLRKECASKKPRAHLLRRLFSRWRIAQSTDDQVCLSKGRLPWYLKP